MITNQIIEVTISQESELQETWTDASVPNMTFCFNETSIDECADNGDGTWTATYSEMIVSAPQQVTYIDVENGKTTYTLAVGTYGSRQSQP
jgi:hypothetical protein